MTKNKNRSKQKITTLGRIGSTLLFNVKLFVIVDEGLVAVLFMKSCALSPALEVKFECSFVSFLKRISLFRRLSSLAVFSRLSLKLFELFNKSRFTLLFSDLLRLTEFSCEEDKLVELLRKSRPRSFSIEFINSLLALSLRRLCNSLSSSLSRFKCSSIVELKSWFTC